MYIITNNLEITEILNPNADYLNKFGEKTGLTNLEFAWNSLKQSQRNVTHFKQFELPTCEAKYYKFEVNQIVEMSEAEKTAKDKQLNDDAAFNILDWQHRDRLIRITVDSILTYTDENYKNWAFRMHNLNVPFNVIPNPDPTLDKTIAYLKFLYTSEGFYIENNVIKHPDNRMMIESVGTIIVNSGMITVE